MPRALKVGTVIRGRYRVDKVLGEGGFGVTYKVWDSKENKIAALKEYYPLSIASRAPGGTHLVPAPGNEESYERFRQDFINEAQTIYSFQNHPNIVSVYHLFGQYNNTAYYAMEYIDGSDLRHFLDRRGGRVSWEEFRPILAQVVTALQAVHNQNVIHCDISADNITITNNGQVKLIDFGAAKRSMHNQGSVVLLRRGYAPLEQMSINGHIGPWTDVYALAVTVYVAMTGEMPPSAENRVQHDGIIWPSQRGIREPFPGWEDALKKALEVRYENRFQNVTDFWNAINDYTQRPQPVVLEGVRGYYAGRRLDIRDECLMGVDAGRCNVTYPIGTPGVSRVHLKIWPQNGKLLSMDMGSRYGSWVNNQKMVPGLVYVLEEGSTVFYGDDQEFRVVRDYQDRNTAYTAPYGHTVF